MKNPPSEWTRLVRRPNEPTPFSRRLQLTRQRPVIWLPPWGGYSCGTAPASHRLPRLSPVRIAETRLPLSLFDLCRGILAACLMETQDIGRSVIRSRVLKYEMKPLASCLMVLGTASDVGKSVIATAICRVLAEEGFHVAPFKAQNMSLNAAVTPDGREIGRAQAAQAEAAGIAPRAEMNPILLKPETDSRSQLVLLGRTAGSISAADYWTQRTDLWPIVTGALHRLRRESDVVVIEGAGAAAELNLRHADVANMRLASHARASALLVGDIERGGIFAQLLGTLDLLRTAERRLVRGLLVNRFRGDPALFASGVRILRRRSGLPVLGVLPYAHNLAVPAEDSVGLERPTPVRADAPDIAVIRYPRISNFDDVEPLSAAGANVRFVRSVNALGVPDLIVLPGSKSTIADLEWLRGGGIGARLRALADAGVPIIGICGGFQMLGQTLHDPTGADGRAGRVRGLSLLPVGTVFSTLKRTVPVAGRIVAESFLGPLGGGVVGYELHLGTTRRHAVRPFAELTRSPSGQRVLDGAVSQNGLVIGTYMHGLFEDDRLRSALIGALSRRRGLPHAATPLPNDRYAELSAWFRSNADVATLLKWIE
jgi:adenosylcobyric acid synthase